MTRDANDRLDISKPDKVLFPDDGLSKQDLADYYDNVAAVMLPHVRGRPITMQRFPEGIQGEGFYQKKTPQHFPDWIERVSVSTSDGRQDQVVVEDRRSLVYLADQACITPHTWLSRQDRLDHPDLLVFDLDPSKPQDVTGARRATRAVGDLLDELGLAAYLKTTGSRGYHVQVPLDRVAKFDTAREFAHEAARLLAARDPQYVTVEQRKDQRGDRVYADVMRNAYAQTAVPPYAVRARPGAPVAAPIEWGELAKVVPDHYTTRSITRRLAQRGDPWEHMERDARPLDEARRRLRSLARS